MSPIDWFDLSMWFNRACVNGLGSPDPSSATLPGPVTNAINVPAGAFTSVRPGRTAMSRVQLLRSAAI
jgi:hypothetical protein